MAGRSSITATRSIYYIVHVLLGVLVNVLRMDRNWWRRAALAAVPAPSVPAPGEESENSDIHPARVRADAAGM
jgi:hypothetical protein